MDRWVSVGSWAVVLLLAACGGTTDPPADAGIAPDASILPPEVVVGSGQDTFVPLDDDDLVELVSGPQDGGRFGGLHIWMGIRMFRIPRDTMDNLTFTITSTNGEMRAIAERDPRFAPLQVDPAQSLLQLIGVNPQVDDCCLIAGKEVDLTARLDTVDDGSFEDTRRVRVSACPGPSEAGPNLCPGGT